MKASHVLPFLCGGALMLALSGLGGSDGKPKMRQVHKTFLFTF